MVGAAVTKRSLLLFSLWAFCMGCAFSAFSYGEELPEFYRGVRAMGMGNAYTAVADDEDSVFYNPAGLAQIHQVRINLLNPKVSASKDDFSARSDVKNAAKSFDSASIARLFGKDLYFNGSVFPNLVFPHFLIGYLAQADFHLTARNLAMPNVQVRDLVDNGLVSGAGFDFHGFSRKHYVRIGASLKWMARAGFDTTIPTSKLITADKSYFEKLSGGPSRGWGTTVGIQYEIPVTRASDLVLGSAFQDIGNLTFSNDLNKSVAPPPVEQNLSAGAAYIHRFGVNRSSISNIKFSAEGRNLTQENRDPRLKLHLGSELEVGPLAFQVGMNDLAYTAGVSVDMWFLKVAAATYAVENETLGYMDLERRYILQLSFSLGFSGKSRTMRQDDRYKYPRDFY